MKAKLILAMICCAAFAGYAQTQDQTSTSTQTSQPGSNSAVGNENPESENTYGQPGGAKNNRVQNGRHSRKHTRKETSDPNDVVGSKGPSSGGMPQTSNSGGSLNARDTQATVGNTSNTNPTASTGNMNPQGSAAGQGKSNTTNDTSTRSHRRTRRSSKASENASPAASPANAASPGQH